MWTQELGRDVPRALAAFRWLTEVYEPTLAAVPEELGDRLSGPELYHQLLEHRWYESERVGHDVGPEHALATFIDAVLRPAVPEAVLPIETGGVSSTELPTELPTELAAELPTELPGGRSTEPPTGLPGSSRPTR